MSTRRRTSSAPRRHKHYERPDESGSEYSDHAHTTETVRDENSKPYWVNGLFKAAAQLFIFYVFVHGLLYYIEAPYDFLSLIGIILISIWAVFYSFRDRIQRTTVERETFLGSAKDVSTISAPAWPSVGKAALFMLWAAVGACYSVSSGFFFLSMVGCVYTTLSHPRYTMYCLLGQF